MNHELKTNPPYYQAVIDGIKRFELRKNDRNFNIGDVLRLREFHPGRQEYTGRYCYVSVDFILTDFPGLEKGYCVMGITQRV